MIKYIFFDFDGVLAESVNIKTEAFRQLYIPYGKIIADRVVEHHILNGGLGRLEKIKYYHDQFLNIQLREEIINQLARKFSKLVLNAVIMSLEVKGTNDFLVNNRKFYNYWLITGTPTKEIRVILKERNMLSFFNSVHGSPTSKHEWIEFIIAKNKLQRDHIVFIGDSLTDFYASQQSNIHFILRETEENKGLFFFFTGPRINDMTDLQNIILTSF